MDQSEPLPPPIAGSELSSLPPTSEQPSGPAGPSGPFRLGLIFIGPHGIRAGWRLAMFAAIAFFFVIVLAAPMLLLSPQTAGGGAWNPVSFIIGDAVPFLAALLAARIMAEIEGRSMGDYALPVRGALGWRFWQGALWGCIALSSVVLAIAAAHGFSFGMLALGGGEGLYYAFMWALAFLAVALCEEFVMRGYALYTLTTGIGFWPSAFLLSALFGAYHLHNRGENRVGVLAAAFIGLFFCFTVRRTGDLWFAVGLHASWDFAQSFVYSVPDSGLMVRGHLLDSSLHGPRWLTGGTVGPEGSVITFIAIVVLFVLFDRVHRDVRFPAGAGQRPDQRTGPSGPRPGSLGLSSAGAEG